MNGRQILWVVCADPPTSIHPSGLSGHIVSCHFVRRPLETAGISRVVCRGFEKEILKSKMKLPTLETVPPWN